MDTRRLIPLILSHFILSSVVAQVSVHVVDPVLEPGESTVVAIEVTDVIPECIIRVYGVHTETLVHFKDTTLHIPAEWPAHRPNSPARPPPKSPDRRRP